MQSSHPKNHVAFKLIGVYNLELWNLLEPLEPLRGTLSWNFETTLLGNPFLEPLLGTLTWNLRTCWNLHLEHWNLLDPFLGSLCLEPLLGTFRNFYLEPLLGTSEPRGTLQDDCPRVPQGLVWLRPQSFQLLGNYPTSSRRPPCILRAPAQDPSMTWGKKNI